MASAAAVAAHAARSPVADVDVDDELDTVGVIAPADGNQRNGNLDDEDEEDEDITAPASRRKPTLQQNGVDDDDDGDDDLNIPIEDGDDDLFGGADSDGELPSKPRQLDDSELDSGDDEARADRRQDEDDLADANQNQQQEEDFAIMDVELGRHAYPEPSDGELYLLKIPQFLSIEPHEFDVDRFEPPKNEHHTKPNSIPPSTFSAYNTATTTVRWRKSRTDPSQLQSNARILRWSDGTLTLQFASKPSTQYVVPGNTLAPAQINPSKPTPTSIRDPKKPRKAGTYDPSDDSFTYLAAPYASSGVVRITNKITTGLRIQPSADATDDALEKLQQSLAASVRGTNALGGTTEAGITTIDVTEDPELAKKKAELAEKEKMRAQRRREAQEMRDRERTGKAFGRRGLGGLSVSGLEDDELGMGVGGGRRSGAPKKRSKPRRGRGGEILSDEEDDYGGRGRTREDEYDEEDDFVAPSDEEEEVPEDDEEEEEEYGEDVAGDDEDAEGDADDAPPANSEKAGRLNRERLGTPKRQRSEDADAEGDPDDAPRAPEGSPGVSRSKRRRVIEDDDEDE